MSQAIALVIRMPLLMSGVQQRPGLKYIMNLIDKPIITNGKEVLATVVAKDEILCGDISVLIEKSTLIRNKYNKSIHP